MCGFAGFVSVPHIPNSGQILSLMGRSIAHRGPDAEGIWQHERSGLGLVHRRLAIQDLSPAGAQPMVSGSGRFVIAFNGEIYNFRALRRELESISVEFRGHSDTEVMLAAFEAWGLKPSLDRFSGMFAFAVFDLQTLELTLARDRMGEKPLYYGLQQGSLVFGSELKALREHPHWKGEVNRDAITLLLRHNSIPAPHTIYQHLFKLPPASFITIPLHSPVNTLPSPMQYWHLQQCFQSQRAWNLKSAADQLESCLTDVIEEQMVSDVPLGAFLSGGIDSSVVTALMQKQSSRPVRTFSIGFREEGFNEAEHAKRIASHLGTEHTELYVAPEDGLSLIPSLPTLYDEPFADSSQLPTYMVSKMTSEHVTVALSGDGGDELFCGYPRYLATADAWANRGRPSAVARRLASCFPPAPTARLIRNLVPGQRDRAVVSIEERLWQERAMASSSSLAEFYRQKVSFWNDPKRLVLGGNEPGYALTASLPSGLSEDSLQALMWLDLNWYLPDDILVKVDRAAMACSLETRVPMLDRRVVEFALGLPPSLNIEDGKGKRVLREVLYRHVPRAMVDRPKQGFAVPLGCWLRTTLRDWAESLLDANRVAQEGFLEPTLVRRLWEAHLAGYDDHSFPLWGVLMFQAWLEQEPGMREGARS